MVDIFAYCGSEMNDSCTHIQTAKSYDNIKQQDLHDTMQYNTRQYK